MRRFSCFLGLRAESDASVMSKPGNEEEEALFAAIRMRLTPRPGFYSRIAKAIKGVTEETTTGVHRLYQMQKRRQPAVPRVQCQRLGHQVEVRQSLRLPRIACRWDQARDRRDDRRQDRLVAGYGDVGKGCAAGAHGALRPGLGHRDRSDLRPAGGDGRLSGRDDGVCRRQGRHLRDRDRQPARDHPRAHARG